MNKIIVISLSIISIHLSNCTKYLDKKNNQNIAIPSNLNDLQLLLNNEVMFSQSSKLNELLSDNYYLTTNDWKTFFSDPTTTQECLSYIWDGNAVYDSWTAPYKSPIYISNVVLDALPKIKGDPSLAKTIRGSALFYRSFYFDRLSQVYCLPFSVNSENEPGIVLRLNSNISEKSSRSTVSQCYQQIINDYLEAIDLLPSKTQYPTMPCKAAALGGLARTYLSMRKYDKALEFAQKCLLEQNSLIDYNTIVVSNNPFVSFNSETIFFSNPTRPAILTLSRAKIDSSLYNSYASDDLRKKLFFRTNFGSNVGTYGFQGSYHGRVASNIFDGITTPEVLLISSECKARMSDIIGAMSDLNNLMVKRWNSAVPYPEITAIDQNDALDKILKERRKELVYRGLRWSDLRRLNLEGANISLKRIIDNKEYILPPNDPRWVALIPSEVINRSGISQNPR